MAIGRPISLTPNIATKNISSLATADQTEFTVTGGYRINEIAVYRNGVRLAEGRDFTASDGDTVTLVNAASTSDVIEFAVFDSFNVSDAIVSAASSQNLNGDFNVTGVFYAGDFKTDGVTVGVSTVSTSLHVGSALTANAAGDVQSIGIITAASFSGDGSALTGLANTDYIVSVATTTGDLKVGAAVTVGGIVNIDATTDSTSSSTGALIVDGGVGIAKNVYIGAGLSVAGTLTYEDVTSVDSVGMVTAKSGVNVSGGQLTVGSGITMGIAGVATFSGTSDVHLLDSVRLNVGDGSDLSIYHDGSHSYINDTGTGYILLGASQLNINNAANDENLARFIEGGACELYYNDSKKFETTNDGVVITGLTTCDGLRMGDDERIKIGDSEDLQIYHHSSHDSYVSNGTGFLSLRSTEDVRLTSSGNDLMVKAIVDGAVEVYYDNSKKFETTNDGTVTTGIGTFTTQININTNGTSIAENNLNFAPSGIAYIDHRTVGKNITFRTSSSSAIDTNAIIVGATGITTFSDTPHDDLGSLRDIPLRSVTGSQATLVVADAGKVVSTNTTGWVVPASTFAEGDTVTLLNNSSGGLTITCSAVTTYLTTDGSTVTSSTLGARGLATLYFVSSSVAYLQGTSLS